MPTRSRPDRRWAAGALSALVPVVLATSGCTGEGAPPATLPVAGPVASVLTLVPSPPPSPSPSVRPATVRPAPRPPGPLAAAIAVVRRYYAATNRLRDAMRPATLGVLFTPGCYCQAQVRAVRQAAARHEHYVDQAHLIALRPSSDGPREVVVLVELAVSRGGLVAADGRRVTSVPPVRDLRRLFGLTLTRGRWLISSIDEVG